MTSVRQAVRGRRRALLRWWSLRGLGREAGPLAAGVAAALRSALDDARTGEERAWFDRIERLRAELDISGDPVTRLDHGAGEPGAGRTAEEMLAGVEQRDTLGQICRRTSKSPFWCTLLFNLVRNSRPDSCIELGTSVGISAAYQAAALELNGTGTFATLEGSPAVADIARDNFRRLGLDRIEVVGGRFQDTLADVLRARQPVDYVFVDGHHDEQATLGYFEQLLPFLAGAALLVFDDIAWSDGMKRAWSRIASDQRVSLAIGLGPLGVCLIDGSAGRRRYYHVPIP